MSKYFPSYIFIFLEYCAILVISSCLYGSENASSDVIVDFFNYNGSLYFCDSDDRDQSNHKPLPYTDCSEGWVGQMVYLCSLMQESVGTPSVNEHVLISSLSVGPFFSIEWKGLAAAADGN